MIAGCADSPSQQLVDHGACDALIDCAANLAPESRDEYEQAYGTVGTCWAGGPGQWQACRDSCEMTLDALNLVAMTTGGASCGTCSVDADCSGEGATCEGGFCVGGMSDEGSEESDGESSDDEPTDGSDSNDDSSNCFEQPAECGQLIECLAVLLPGQDLGDFEPGGSCWCGTEEEAAACYQTCVDQLESAVADNPTLVECHGRYCPIEELEPNEPYGPPPCANGLTLLDDLPVPGSYCAPACEGLAEACIEHSQTIAQGTCMWSGNPNLCAMRCYVDPYIFASGTQCQCGATCQPYGGVDGDGNARGICTFE